MKEPEGVGAVECNKCEGDYKRCKYYRVYPRDYYSQYERRVVEVDFEDCLKEKVDE